MDLNTKLGGSTVVAVGVRGERKDGGGHFLRQRFYPFSSRLLPPPPPHTALEAATRSILDTSQNSSRIC